MLLSPQFYAADFNAVAQKDLSDQTDGMKAVLGEVCTDDNRHHFVRTQGFEQDWERIDRKSQRSLIDCLAPSCAQRTIACAARSQCFIN